MSQCIFEENLDILKSLNKEKLVSENSYKIEKTKDNKYTFQYFCESGKKVYINSKYNVKSEIEKLFEGIDFTKNNLFVVYGIGLGYHITELIKRSTDGSRIFVIEKDMKILNTYLRCKSMTELGSEKITLFFGDERQIISLLSYYLFKFSILKISKNYIPVILSSYYLIYGDWIKKMNNRITDLIRHEFFKLGNDVTDTIDGLENNFKNMKELIKSPSIEEVKKSYLGKPAIIVGAGPSLDKNIAELKKIQGKALILATDAVIGTLNKKGIIPDAIFTIERVITTYNSFYKDNYIDEKIVFIGPPVVRNEILDKMKFNKKLLCLKQGESINEWINDSILKENRLINMGTSCAHIALSFAKYVGADPIVFVGMDLAYTKDGTTHSSEVEIKRKADLQDKSLIYVEDINGNMIPTNYPLKNFLTFIETELARDYGNRTYIDATEGGAYKKGSKIMTLKQTIDKYCNEDIEKLYNLVAEESNFDKLKYNRAVEELRKFGDKIKYLETEILKHIKKIKKIIDSRINLKQTCNMLKKKDKVERIIYDDAIIRLFLQGIYITEKIKENSISTKISEKNVRDRLNIRIRLMVLLYGACNKIYDSINNILKDMKRSEL